MRRVIVIGGSGFFGGLVAQKLRESAVQPLIASRTRGEVRVDAENPGAAVREGDIVIDAAGPFQKRSPALVDAAIAEHFDLIDLSDSPEYSSAIYAREAAISAAGVRVLTACSALSTISAIAASRVEKPIRLTAYLVPASRYTANPATTASVTAALIGQRRTLTFPTPLGHRDGVTVRSVDEATLPRIFPSLRTTEFVVDAGMNILFQTIGRSNALRKAVSRLQPIGLWAMKRIGKRKGLLAYEVQSDRGVSHLMFLGAKTYLLAALPAVCATLRILNGQHSGLGVVAPTDHVDAAELFAAARAEAIDIIG